MPCLVVKLNENTRWWGLRVRMTNHPQVTPTLSKKSGLGSAISKTSSRCFVQTHQIDKMAEKKAFIMARTFLTISDDFKISPQLLYSLIKFDEKHDGEGNELLQPTIFHLNFWQKWGSDEPKIVLAQFWWWIRIRRPWQHCSLNDVSSKSNESHRMAENNTFI